MQKVITNYSQKIVINGKEFSSIDEVPVELKKYIEDADANGIPDYFEQLPEVKKITKEFTTNFSLVNASQSKDTSKSDFKLQEEQDLIVRHPGLLNRIKNWIKKMLA